MRMSMLVVDRRGSRLELDGAAIMIRVPHTRPRWVPVRKIKQLVISGAVDLDARVFTRLAAEGASIVMLPGRGTHEGVVLHGSSHGDARRRLGQYALIMNPARRLGIARLVVRLRMQGIRRLLLEGLRMRPDQRRQMLQSRAQLLHARQQIGTTVDIATLRGLEGAGARALFSALRALLPEAIEFSGRNRRPPRDPANALLSLGYTLLHGDAVRALQAAGMDPLLGVLHEPVWHRESLACDLVEIARSRIEWMTWRLFAEERLSGSDFTMDGGACRLSKTSRGRFFSAYADMAPLHRKWFRSASHQLAALCSEASDE